MGKVTEFARELISVKTYDTPDGENCVEKLVATTKTGALVGAYFSVFDMFAGSTPASLPMMVGRFFHFTLPAAGAAAAFAGTTCIAGQMRGHDGPSNHALGGVAAGLAIAAKVQSWRVAMGASLGLAAVMSFYKVHRDEGHYLLKQSDRKINTYNPQQTPGFYGKKFGYEEYKKPDYE